MRRGSFCWNFVDEDPLLEYFTNSKLCGAAFVSDWLFSIGVVMTFFGVFKSVELPQVLTC